MCFIQSRELFEGMNLTVGPPSWGFGEGLTTHGRERDSLLRNVSGVP